MEVSTNTFNLANADFSSIDGLKQQLTIKQVENKVASLQRTYYTVNVAEALNQLKDVGELLRIAYAGTQGRRCAVQVVTILCDYQHMVKNTFIVTGSFIESSLSALNAHRIALKFLKQGKLGKALERLSKCAEMANEMAALCAQLTLDSDKLIAESKEAVVGAVDEIATTNAEKKKIIDRINTANADRAERETRKLAIESELQRVRADEEAEISRQDQAAQRAFILGMVKIAADAIGQFSPAKVGSINVVSPNSSTSAAPAANGGAKEEESKTSDNPLIAIRNARYEKEKECRENSAQLSRQLEELKNLSVSRDDLMVALKSLEVASTSLGRIHTIFENTRLFWVSVEKNCKALASTASFNDAIDLDDSDEFNFALMESAYKWMCLANINHCAHEAMIEANTTIDQVMILPTSQQAQQIIDNQIPKMLRALENNVEELNLNETGKKRKHEDEHEVKEE